jgi:hypothetical protein
MTDRQTQAAARPPFNHPSFGLRPGLIWYAAFVVAWMFCSVQRVAAADENHRDIRELSQHFLDRSGNTAPWIFVPKENIASLSTSEHPGVVTIWEAGRGKDVKGILTQPIRTDEYPLPWEFHLGLIQNYQGMKGISEGQINYAIGLNLVATFSDPKTWPKDRTQLPPDSHSLQLFLVHLGSTGENYRSGIPQIKGTPLNQFDPSPEVYLVYGRGDLGPAVNGNWKMNYTWLGAEGALSGSSLKSGGPANSIVRFRAVLLGPTTLQVGVGFGADAGWRNRTLDVSRFGKITGIWEIGPIISLDRWIPDVLPRELHIESPPAWLQSWEARLPFLGKPARDDAAAMKRLAENFKVQPPDGKFAYFIDYAVFRGIGPESFEQLSDEFNVPGFLADQQWYLEGSGLAETYSHPGYLTVTLLGMSGAWAMCPIMSSADIDLSRHRMPLEFETAFIAPEDTSPWNFWWTMALLDNGGKVLGQGWQPGVQNIPGQGRRFINAFSDPTKFSSGPFHVEFEPPLPQSVLCAKPVYMLVQVLDTGHVRVGFKARAADAWLFSNTLDLEKSLGKSVARIGYPCLVSLQGASGQKGWGMGNYPRYQQFLIDYVRFRSGGKQPSRGTPASR